LQRGSAAQTECSVEAWCWCLVWAFKPTSICTTGSEPACERGLGCFSSSLDTFCWTAKKTTKDCCPQHLLLAYQSSAFGDQLGVFSSLLSVGTFFAELQLGSFPPPLFSHRGCVCMQCTQSKVFVGFHSGHVKNHANIASPMYQSITARPQRSKSSPPPITEPPRSMPYGVADIICITGLWLK